MEEESNSILDKIRTWLREEEIQDNKIDNTIGITFWYSKEFPLAITVIHDKITILCELRFDDAIRNLVLSNKIYLHELDLSLHQQTPRFTFLYSDNAHVNLFGVRIFKDIWPDSLTKTSFFDAIVSVEHSTYIVFLKSRQWAMLTT
jgi:hypothetical protein